MELLRGNFLLNQAEEALIANDALRDVEYIALYFSASWCPACFKLLPLVKDVYQEAKRRDVKMEIVYVPADRDAEQMTRHFVNQHGPWFDF